MVAVLGISAFYHDSAATLVVDGDIVAAAQEERFSRRKHDPSFPSRAVAYCLVEAGLRPDQVDYLAFYEKPLKKFERLLETYLAFVPEGFSSFRKAMPVWLEEKLHLRRVLLKGLNGSGRVKVVFTDHHESHAASAFFPSPFEEAAVLTIDGVGEWTTTAFGTGSGNRVALSHHVPFPHSLGLLYSAFTYYCGFKVNSGEYKLMGMAPYGRPVYVNAIHEHLLDLKPDGSFRLEMDYFRYCQGLTMTGRRFHRLFGGPPRRPESPIEQRHMDLAASIQSVTEEAVLRIGRVVHERTGMKNLTMAGGVALNCVANGRLLREGPFDDVWVQPAAGDAGGSLGAALFVWHQLLGRPRRGDGLDSMKGGLLGPRPDPEDVRRLLVQAEEDHRRLGDAELFAEVARLLAEEKVVGWFRGRMEFGPRALGARSILADPRSPRTQAALNRKIKFREGFRPFAPCVLREHASEWFDLPPGRESPYMLMVAPVLASRRVPIPEDQAQVMQSDPDLCRRVNVVRSTIPAVTHVDYSARIQTVDAGRNPDLDHLLRAFYQRTGCPVLVNTSFNVRGEPIVCTPGEAYRSFRATDMDALVLGDTLIVKGETTRGDGVESLQDYLAQFPLD